MEIAGESSEQKLSFTAEENRIAPEAFQIKASCAKLF